jgi:phenylacetate-CoA ligase
MKFAESLRKNAFWFIDYIKGGDVRNHYEDIRFILENRDHQKAEERCNSYLLNILRHATSTTQFYSRYNNFNTLEDFPVINKTTVKENSENFLSSLYKTTRLHKVTTSGSTGAPLTIWQDQGKRLRHQAENILFSEMAEYPLGSRLYYLRVWNQMNSKSLIKRFQENIIMQNASDLSDKNLESFIKRLEKDSSYKSILAFSSTHEVLSRYVAEKPHPLPVKVNSLITISETLPEGAKLILKSAFRCPVVSRYSNMENGFLAQQCIKENHEYHMNTASFYFEILNLDKDEPVLNDQPGRVVITDLFNYAMPLIRYDTGDIAVVSKKSSCGKSGPVFKMVEGRKVDLIQNTKGQLLSPHVVTNTMWKYSTDIRQFQFIQNGLNDYLVKLNCIRPSFSRSDELIADLRHYLGQDANIEIDLVNEIPILASGKRKKIVNNYTKS